MLGLQLPHTYTLTLPAHCITLQVTMPELKGKYAPFFELLVDTIKNKKLLKCKLCADETTLSYNGNTSSMKAHLEARHRQEYRSLGGMFDFILKLNFLHINHGLELINT